MNVFERLLLPFLIVGVVSNCWADPGDTAHADAEADGSISGAINGPSNYSDDVLADLVKQLGGDEYRVREDATYRLIQIGVPAKSHVQSGVDSSDLEIRLRSGLILEEIKLRERNDLVGRFLSSSDSPSHGGLPGWELFSKLAGDEERARQAYAKMLQQEWAFIADVVGAADESGESSCSPYASQYLINRSVIAQNSMRMPNSRLHEGTLLALLFTASLDGIDMTNAGTVLGFCSRRECSRYFSGADGIVMSKLLAKVILKPQGDETLAQRLFLASKYELRDGVELARSVVSRSMVRSYVRQSGLMIIARFGDKEVDGPLLEPLLNDSTPTIQNRSVQIRDVALATLIQLNGDDPIKFGFKNATRTTNGTFVASSLGFPSQEDRKRAFDKWTLLKSSD